MLKFITIENLNRFFDNLKEYLSETFYIKPDSGISKSELDSDVQSSLSKADTALQSEQYTGTVNELIIDNVTISAENGIANLGYINKELVTSTSSSMTLSPNVYYRNTNTSLSSLTINFNSASNDKIINEYLIEFTTSNNGTTISLPSSIKWENGKTPSFDKNTTYQISVINNLGVCIKFY